MSDPQTPKSQETKPAREIGEQTQKHIDRFLQGREAWNKWANEMLAKKEELEKAGTWKVKEEFEETGLFPYSKYDESTPEFQSWLDDTEVDFSKLSFITTQTTKGNQNKKSIDIGEFSEKTNQIYVNEINFGGFVFPGFTDFSSTNFQGKVSFFETEFCEHVFFTKTVFSKQVTFTKVKFNSGVSFKSARFKNFTFIFNAKFRSFASFENSNFRHGASFFRVKFCKNAIFEKTKFKGNASFSYVEFRGLSSFHKASFYHNASFDTAKFYNLSNFMETKFYSNISFASSTFEKTATFAKTEFKEKAHFEGTKFKHIIILAGTKFTTNIPNFTQASFVESPRLDNIEVLPAPIHEDYPFPSKKIQSSLKWQRYWWNLQYRAYLMRLFWRCVYKLTPSNYRKLYHKGEILKHIWSKFRNTRRDKNEEAHYRALKRLAIQAHDHENEMKFFAGEIRARRHITDFANFLTHDFASSMRYWAGVAYELFSDFGRSFIRPALWWFACLWLFANLTLSGSGLVDKTKCHNSQLTPKEAAYTIGLKNSLLILGLTKTNIVKQAELCLYGLNKNGANKNGEADREPKPYDPKIKRTYQTKSTKAEPTKTDIPFKAVWQGIIHSGLSLLFIFLLLLAIRNQFKIK